MFIICFFPAAFVALMNIGPLKTYNVAISQIIPFSFLTGGGLVPTLMGVLGEYATFSIGFIFMGGFLLGNLFLILYLKLPKKNILLNHII